MKYAKENILNGFFVLFGGSIVYNPRRATIGIYKCFNFDLDFVKFFDKSLSFKFQIAN